MIAIHWTFNYTLGDRRLLLQWMKLSCEFPASSERDYKAVGLSGTENKKFWAAEKRWNGIWYQSVLLASLINGFVFSIQLFFVSFDVNFFTYVFFQIINIIHTYYFIFRFLNLTTLNFLLLTLIRFFRKKFYHIAGQVERLHLSNRKRVNNKKLTRFLYEYNVVHLELFAMRDLFKQLIGFNLSHYFVIGLLTNFACLFVDIRMAVAAVACTFVLGLAVMFPFYFATAVITEVILV